MSGTSLTASNPPSRAIRTALRRSQPQRRQNLTVTEASWLRHQLRPSAGAANLASSPSGVDRRVPSRPIRRERASSPVPDEAEVLMWWYAKGGFRYRAASRNIETAGSSTRTRRRGLAERTRAGPLGVSSGLATETRVGTPPGARQARPHCGVGGPDRGG